MILSRCTKVQFSQIFLFCNIQKDMTASETLRFRHADQEECLVGKMGGSL